MTGAYDPEQNLLFYGIGNPGPDYHSESRKGDNLYSDSLVALDADTGKLRWHYQFTPHDVHDWDATEVPILADLTIGGQPRKVVMFANRNGFFYTLDRTTGKRHRRQAVREDDVGEGDRRATAGRCCCPGHMPDEKGAVDVSRPHRRHELLAADASIRRRGTFFVNAREACMTFYRVEARVQAGRALHRRRRPARASVGDARRTARCARSIPRPASGSGSSST